MIGPTSKRILSLITPKIKLQFLKFCTCVFNFSEVKYCQEAKVEFVEKLKLNLLSEKEKEILKLFLLENKFRK